MTIYSKMKDEWTTHIFGEVLTDAKPEVFALPEDEYEEEVMLSKIDYSIRFERPEGDIMLHFIALTEKHALNIARWFMARQYPDFAIDNNCTIWVDVYAED